MTDEDVPLPELQVTMLDGPGLEQLLFDVTHAATLLEVRLKGGPTAMAGDASPSLADARAALERGDAMAMQLRYAFRGTVWVDTLMRVGGGTRLVRMADVTGTSALTGRG